MELLPVTTVAAGADACTLSNETQGTGGVPRIGDPWPGVDGIYAGISRGEAEEPDAHLVLLPALPDRALPWAEAVQWAQGLGDGAHLPSRSESALLYAHLRDDIDKSDWYWTGSQYSAGYAWGQDFDGGYQYGDDKKFKARARAVRRFPL
jgi:hypothetical protein